MLGRICVLNVSYVDISEAGAEGSSKLVNVNMQPLVDVNVTADVK